MKFKTTKEKIKRGMTVPRFFTDARASAFDSVEWERRTASITDSAGGVIFEQEDVEVPKAWSQLATNIVASKYFRGHQGTTDRETSVRQLIGRVANTITDWGFRDGYFASVVDANTFLADLTHLLLHQMLAFNSPVWFNVGAEQDPQCSACFINSVEDSMESIMEFAATEARLFKGGSGSGANLSTLRSSKEKLAGSGTASGPLSFMRGFDAFAGAIKSGGKTRRAAKMVMLNVDHPDIMQFIESKAKEERKAWALIGAGYDGSVNGEAYGTVAFQNANHSIRVSDAFMQAAQDGRTYQTHEVVSGEVSETLYAKSVLRAAAEAAYVCGDPGVQYDDTINAWHTTPNSGRINGSNPCSEYMSLDDSACNLASLNLMKFVDRDMEFQPQCFMAAIDIAILAMEILVDNSSYPTAKIAKNTHDFRQLGLGYANLGALLMAKGMPYDSDDGRSLAAAITSLMTGRAYLRSADIARHIGPFAGFPDNRIPMLDVIGKHIEAASWLVGSLAEVAKEQWAAARSLGAGCGFRHAQATVLAPTGTIAFMMDCFTGDTRVAVADGRNAVPFKELADAGEDVDVYASEKGRTVIRRMRCPQLIRRQVETVKVTFDDGSDVRCTPDHRFLLRDGTYAEARDLLPGTSLMRFDSAVDHTTGSPRRSIWMGPEAGGNRCRGASWRYQYRLFGERQFPGYDGRSGGIVHHLNEDSLDDRPANLGMCENFSAHLREHWASLSAGERSEVIRARQAARTPEQRIAASRKAHDAQTPEARKARARKAVEARTSEERGAWTAAGWKGISAEDRSARLKKGWETRRQNAVHNHKVVSVTPSGIDDVYCGTVDGTSNFAIVTNNACARSGDLSGVVVHNCDTTGIEPDIALVKYKRLVGGGTLKIVNQTVGLALRRLDYFPPEVAYIESYIEKNGTVEGCRELRPQHLPIFDCAFPPANGTRSISPDGHLRMMAAVQPFLAGAISKTVNLPASATVDDIVDVYVAGWKLGLKAVAVYRDGCKQAQPLSTGEKKAAPAAETSLPSEGSPSMPTDKIKAGLANPSGGIIKRTGRHPTELEERATIETAARLSTSPEFAHVESPLILDLLTAAAAVTPAPVATRRRMPETRQSVTHRFAVAGHEGYLTVGLHDDGTPGELFVTMSKEGSTVSGLMNVIGLLTSLALQSGVPLSTLVDKLSHLRFEPSGFTGNPEIPFAKSFVDYIFRWVGGRFGDKPAVIPETAGAAAARTPVIGETSDAPACAVCGTITVRAGSCYCCPACGATTGCS